jgi:hypothetical protein
LRKCPSRTESCGPPAADRRASGPRRDGCCCPRGDCRSMIALSRISSDSMGTVSSPEHGPANGRKDTRGQTDGGEQKQRANCASGRLSTRFPATDQVASTGPPGAGLIEGPVRVAFRRSYRRSYDCQGKPERCRTAHHEISPWSSPDRRSLGCRVKSGSDLGAIGDVHLIARLQVLDEGLHSRGLHVDSVGHGVRYRVFIDRYSSIIWETMIDGHTVRYRDEPGTGFRRCLVANLLKLLPIDSQL